MPFTMKLKEIVHVADDGTIALNPRIRAVTKAKKLPFKAQYDLSKIGKRLEAELREFVEHREDLIKELGEEIMIPGKDGEPDVGTGSFRVKVENIKAFSERANEMLDHEITVDVNPMKSSELGTQVEGTTADDLIACHAFILEG